MFLILLPVSVLMLVFFVGTAKATSESFVIGPKQQAVEYIDLSVSDQANGSMSVSVGQIDFFIKDPDGLVLQQFLNA